MKAYFTPLRVITVVGLSLLLTLWCVSMVGLMGKTRLGKIYRQGSSGPSH